MRKTAMKRKGKKSGKVEENGVNAASENDNTDQNSDTENEENHGQKKKKQHDKRKSGRKTNDFEEYDEKSKLETDKKRKSDKRKSSFGKKTDESVDDEEEEEETANEVSKNKPDKKKRALSSEEELEGDSQYEVEAILDEKYIRGVKHYLIRWKGYEPESDTWEPESTVNCKELIQKYKAERGNSKSEKKKKDAKKGGAKKTKANDDIVDWDENEQFEVDRILEVHFRKDGKREFLVSWKGYPQSQSSWEPEENMNCPDLIEKFMIKVEKAKEAEQRELRVAPTPTSRFTLDPQANERRMSKRHKKKQRVHYYDAE